MNTLLKSALALAAVAIAGQAAAQVTFYERDDFGGRSFTAQYSVQDFRSHGFNDRASSAVVTGERWEACDDAHFGGRCVTLRPGRYPSLAAMGMNDRISSVRTVDWNARDDDGRDSPAAMTDNGYRRRDNERLYQAEVTSVHAVVGPAEQRCWIAHEQVAQEQSGPNIGGAVAGALIGGILGHQVGGGSGRDLATVGGVVAGGAIGSQVGRNGNPPTRTQDVQRCRDVPNTAVPAYWDVTYNFRSQEHHVQMTSPPGHTISVNHQGEPRT